ncbi:single-pass membrane and coiled-coil domain-containing protein 2 [Manis javanica]|uniref:single-pass membrane and coiled-coil domain-containing protein 2 n=1 Tax=Manis javanica TaxID=9974 RepID=UPI003C6D46A1
MALTKLSDTMSLQMKMAGKEEQLTEKNSGFLQNIDMADSVVQNLLREFTERDHVLNGPDEEDGIFSENPQSNFLHRGMLQLEAENDQDLLSEQAEQGVDQAQREDPQVSTSLWFSEQDVSELSQETTFFKFNHWNTQMDLQVKELGADHTGWMEKMNNIIQKINLTENSEEIGYANPFNKLFDQAKVLNFDEVQFINLPFYGLLNEVMSLEGQIEKLELQQDLNSDQGTNMEVCTRKLSYSSAASTSPPTGAPPPSLHHPFVKAQLKCHLLFQTSPHLCWKMTPVLNPSPKNLHTEDISLMNTKLRMYQTQEGKTDPLSPEEMEPLLPQVLPPPLGQNSPPRVTTWKRAQRIFIIFYGLTFAGLSCYILFLDPTFVFERTLPTVFGRRRMWELREIIAPFLNLKVEDLLPS